ncbi:MAG: FAD-binding oxidoreductase [Nocardiopsaceae bacterium]|nr:FAD-binding oxidoreductase [Nocardiopsaceae bacterium]
MTDEVAPLDPAEELPWWQRDEDAAERIGRPNVVVVGAGVAGLTTAISLADAGLTTELITADLGSGTTSIAAGAIWGPVRCGPPDRIRAWSAVGLEVLTQLESQPAAGVRPVSGVEVAASPSSPEDWLDLTGRIRPLEASELPPGMACGWRYTAPVVTMPLYLEYLRQWYEALGGTITVSTVRSLAEDTGPAPIVVNCTGIGARELAGDPSVYPVRGQVVVVENPGIEEFYIDHTMVGDQYIYIFPHKEVVILGGTAEEGAWDLSPRQDLSEQILAACASVDPRLRGARVVDERVGLRPCRDEVRVESEPLPGGRVLWHNYGHGGGGVTLSWGCAREITEAIIEGPSASSSR